MSQPNSRPKKVDHRPPFKLKPLAQRICTGIDKVWFYVDLADMPEKVLQLIGDSGEVRSESPDFAPHLQTKIVLFQPSVQLLIDLDQALRGIAEVLINYVEFAVDYLPPPSVDMRDAVVAVLGLMHPIKGQQPVLLEDHGTTYYFERRYLEPAEKKRKRPRVRALYADKPSKLAAASGWEPRPCVHIESRLSGKDILERVGVVTLRDLIEFDHQAFWLKEVVFVKNVNFTEIGKWLKGAQMARTSWVRAGKGWTSQHQVNGVFCLHNAWIQRGAGRVFGEFSRFTNIFEFWTSFERKALPKT